MVKLSQGDIIRLDFDPQAGHEQKGRRPAIVISNSYFNRYSKTILLCPIINTDKNHPFHVRLNTDTRTTGVILCDQLKALNIIAREFDYVEKAPKDIILETLNTIDNFMELEE